MRLMVFHFNVCVKRAYVPGCFCSGQLCAIAISGSSQDLLVPLRPGLVHSSGFRACFRIPVFVDWQISISSLCDWISLDASLCRLVCTPASRLASTSATMDLTAVLPALMEGIAQEVGVDMNELKVVLVGDETQLDVKPFQILKEQYHQIEWDYKRLDQLHNPEPYVEIGLKQDAPLLQSYTHQSTTASL